MYGFCHMRFEKKIQNWYILLQLVSPNNAGRMEPLMIRYYNGLLFQER